jgi:O-antigen/teichoic acid export membrane protein
MCAALWRSDAGARGLVPRAVQSLRMVEATQLSRGQMIGVKRALLLVTVERYFGMVVQFALIAAVSRLLTPGEIGVCAIGMGIIGIAFSLRDFATSDFLIQRKTVTREDVRTSFTLLLGLTGLITAVMFVLAPWIAGYYGETGLSCFLYLIAATGLLEVVRLPITALLQRDMAFGTLAMINMASVALSAAVTLTLAMLGFSYMSFAWAGLCAAATATVLSLYFRPYLWIFRPLLSSWRAALTFGSCYGSTGLLYKIYDSFPQLVLGRIVPISAVGLYNRANVIYGIPERFLLSQVSSVAFPAFAARMREGHSVKQPYLQAISYLTGVHWPALIIVALLAHPIVAFVLGEQWISTVPLVQIMCGAGLFWSPVILTHQLLIAFGAKHNLVPSLIARPTAALVLCGASFFGLTALAASQLLTTPFQLYVALRFIRLHVPFRWGELVAAAWRSALITACTAAGPTAVIVLAGFRANLSIGAALVAGLLSACCWAGGLWLTSHPLLHEIEKVFCATGISSRGRWLIAVGWHIYR